MTKQELNKDIKRLLKMQRKDAQLNILPEFEAEYKRLYRADTEMEYMNVTSIKIMLRLNVLYRFIPFHQFGLFIDLDKIK
jgi:hypothetical protein